jgi:hypothetical protein
MQKYNFKMLVCAFILGVLLGMIATMTLYTRLNNRVAEGERQQAEEALKKIQYERDDALARIDAYLEGEKQKQLDLQSPGGEAAGTPGAEIVAAPEVLPAPQEEPSEATKSATSLGFGPPRQFGKN